MTNPVEPKSGYLTTAFIVWLASFSVGGVLTYLIRKGLPKDLADANRPFLVDAVTQLLPIVWLSLSAWLGRAVIRTREIVTRAKAETMIIEAKAKAEAASGDSAL